MYPFIKTMACGVLCFTVTAIACGQEKTATTDARSPNGPLGEANAAHDPNTTADQNVPQRSSVPWTDESRMPNPRHPFYRTQPMQPWMEPCLPYGPAYHRGDDQFHFRRGLCGVDPITQQAIRRVFQQARRYAPATPTLPSFDFGGQGVAASAYAGNNESVSVSQQGDQWSIEMSLPDLHDETIRYDGTAAEIHQQVQRSDLPPQVVDRVLAMIGL
jgi:hypothetical protein